MGVKTGAVTQEKVKEVDGADVGAVSPLCLASRPVHRKALQAAPGTSAHKGDNKTGLCPFGGAFDSYQYS